MADKDHPNMPTVEKLKNLKRSRATQRAHATRFENTINTFNGSTDTEELEHYRTAFRRSCKF
jgi:hypothetical protein